MSAKSTSWPCPVAWEDATSVNVLCDLLDDSNASIYALRLWHHRRRSGADVPVLGAVERLAGWKGQRGVLADALLKSGLVAPLGEIFTIVAWESVALVDWTRSGGDKGQKPKEPKAPKAGPSADALRKWNERHPGVPHPSTVRSGPDSRQSESSPSPDSAQSMPGLCSVRVQSESSPSPVQSGLSESESSPVRVRPDSPDQSGETHSDPRTRTCATVTVTVTDTGVEEPSSAAAAGRSPKADREEPRLPPREQDEILPGEEPDRRTVVSAPKAGKVQEVPTLPGIAPEPSAKPKKTTKAPADPAKAAEREAERIDGERWVAEARKLLGPKGLSASEAPWGAAWHVFTKARTRYTSPEEPGIEKLMRALRGLRNIPPTQWPRNGGLKDLASDSAIQKGLGAVNGPALAAPFARPAYAEPPMRTRPPDDPLPGPGASPEESRAIRAELRKQFPWMRSIDTSDRPEPALRPLPLDPEVAATLDRFRQRAERGMAEASANEPTAEAPAAPAVASGDTLSSLRTSEEGGSL